MLGRLRATAALAGLLLAAACAGACRPTPPAPSSRDGGSRPTGSTTPTASSAGARASDPRIAASVVGIGWVGDVTPGSRYGMPPEDGRALFARTREHLQAPDLMIGNLEGTFGTGGPSKCAGKDPKVCYAFQAPPKNAAALAWAGFDMVSLANNHSRDYLARGLSETRAALERVGVSHTGLPDQIAIETVRGVRVAVLGFAPYWWTGDLRRIQDGAWASEVAARKADVVVVVMHAGAEGGDEMRTPKGEERAFGESRGRTRDFAHACVDSGADLVLGSGPHVLRGIERYGDRLIAYSLGNFAGWSNFSLAGPRSLSGILTVRVDGTGRVRGGRLMSVRIDEPGVPRVDDSHESARLVARLSRQDFPRTYPMDARGVISAE